MSANLHKPGFINTHQLRNGGYERTPQNRHYSYRKTLATINMRTQRTIITILILTLTLLVNCQDYFYGDIVYNIRYDFDNSREDTIEISKHFNRISGTRLIYSYYQNGYKLKVFNESVLLFESYYTSDNGQYYLIKPDSKIVFYDNYKYQNAIPIEFQKKDSLCSINGLNAFKITETYENLTLDSYFSDSIQLNPFIYREHKHDNFNQKYSLADNGILVKAIEHEGDFKKITELESYSVNCNSDLKLYLPSDKYYLPPQNFLDFPTPKFKISKSYAKILTELLENRNTNIVYKNLDYLLVIDNKGEAVDILSQQPIDEDFRNLVLKHFTKWEPATDDNGDTFYSLRGFTFSFNILQDAVDLKNHIKSIKRLDVPGKWIGEDKEMTIRSDGFIELSKGKSKINTDINKAKGYIMTYEIDYSSNPIDFDFVFRKGEDFSEISRLYSIIKFKNKKTMLMNKNPDTGIPRPTDFEGENTFELKK
jgi:hypothetical protein